MKLHKYILIEIVMIALAVAVLFWLTKSYVMSLGIIVLLVVVEHVLVSRLEQRQEQREEREEAEDATAD